MTKLELIKILEQYPDDAEIEVPLSDGSPASYIEPTYIRFEEETKTIILDFS